MEYRIWHDHYDYDVPTTLRYPRILVHDTLQIPANSHPDKAAILYEGQEITFWELRQLVLRFANALKALGVDKGERVGIHLPTCPQYVIAFRAVLSLGAIVVNLNPLYPANELITIADQTTLTTLITIDKALPSVRQLCQELKIPRVIVSDSADFTASAHEPTPTKLEEGWHHFSEILQKSTNTDRVRVEIKTDDPAVIQFTGGTTGVPKGAVLTHANVIAATVHASVWTTPRVKRTSIEKLSTLIVIPLYHVYGNLISNWAIYNCATQILMPQFDIDKLMGIIGSKKEITYFCTVPTMASAIMNHPKAKEIEIGKILGVMHMGAAPCPIELMEQIKNAGIFLTEGWAMSETACSGTGNPVMGMRKVGSIGIPRPDTDIKLVDLNTGETEVPQGEPGEIIIKGPQVMKEYWNNPVETANQLKDGWLSTGDIAIQDEDGYLFIIDRKKDMIISGGFNIYPREVDEVLFQHPKVEFGIAVGVPDQYRGETLKAFVVLKKGEVATEKEIIDFCKDNLAAYKVPKFVEFRESLPQSSVGKVLRKELREEEIKKAGKK